MVVVIHATDLQTQIATHAFLTHNTVSKHRHVSVEITGVGMTAVTSQDLATLSVIL